MSPAVGEQTASLPILTACQPAAAPLLPERWHAIALMWPLTRSQLDVGEFEYDATVPAMRATVTGLESGAVDLLITDRQTYRLGGPRDAPDSCTVLGPKFKPPSRQWLSDQAVCEGESQLGVKRAQWWKVPFTDGRTQRQWYATDTRLPWRIMFPDRTAEPAVFGDYAITYFPRFEPRAQSSLAALRDFCAAKARQGNDADAGAVTVRDLMAAAPDVTATERERRVQSQIPGLSQKACAGDKPPTWPHQFMMTGILTPVQFKWTPLPSLLFYDWETSATLFAYMHSARADPPAVEIVSVLKDEIGYSVERQPNGGFACGAKGPGVVRPDWMEIAGCECKAVVARHPQLSPDEPSVIRACPIVKEGTYPMWSWYGASGRPILFTEPRATSTGLHIADYHRWLPGEKMPPDSFAVPKHCTNADSMGLPPVGTGLSPPQTVRCLACHVAHK